MDKTILLKIDNTWTVAVHDFRIEGGRVSCGYKMINNAETYSRDSEIEEKVEKKVKEALKKLFDAEGDISTLRENKKQKRNLLNEGR